MFQMVCLNFSMYSLSQHILRDITKAKDHITASLKMRVAGLNQFKITKSMGVEHSYTAQSAHKIIFGLTLIDSALIKACASESGSHRARKKGV